MDEQVLSIVEFPTAGNVKKMPRSEEKKLAHFRIEGTFRVRTVGDGIPTERGTLSCF